MAFANNATIFKRRVGLTDSTGAEAGGLFLVGVADPAAAAVAAATGTLGTATDGTLWRKTAGSWVTVSSGSTGLSNPMPDDVPFYFGTGSDYQLVYDSASSGFIIQGVGADATTQPLIVRSKGGTGTGGAATFGTGAVAATGANPAVSGKVTVSTGGATSGTGTARTGDLALTVPTPTTGGVATRGIISLAAGAFKTPAVVPITTAGAAFRYTAPMVLAFYAETGAVNSVATITGSITLVSLRKTGSNGGAGASATLAVGGTTVCAFDLSTSTEDDVFVCESIAAESFAIGDTVSLTLAGADPECSVTVWFVTATD